MKDRGKRRITYKGGKFFSLRFKSSGFINGVLSEGQAD